MRIILLLLIIIGAGILSLKGPPAIAQDDVLPTWEPADCEFHVGPNVTIDCGYVTVPQVRGNPDAGTVRLHVAIYRSPNPNKMPDPLVFLSVGPGVNTSFIFSQSLPAMFEPFLVNRDVIMIDQRGSGHSKPKLDCPEMDALYLSTLSDPAAYQTQSANIDAACWERYQAEGAVFAGYSSKENAADIDAIRQLLGYEQINLLGVSYGSRLALTVMRDYPHTVRSAILDSVIPLDANFMEEHPLNFQAGLDQLFADCAAQPSCQASYPTLAEDFYRLVSAWNETPARFYSDHPWTFQRYEVTMTGDMLADFVQLNLQKMNISPVLPYLIYAASNNEFELFSEVYKVAMTVPGVISDGANFLTWCADEVPFNDPEQIQQGISQIRPELHSLFASSLGVFDSCAEFAVAVPDAIENQPVVSAIPTLLISGEYDVFAPVRWGEQAARTLSNSFHFVIPGGGNGAVGYVPCANYLVFQFLDNPMTEPEASCLAEIPTALFSLEN